MKSSQATLLILSFVLIPSAEAGKEWDLGIKTDLWKPGVARAATLESTNGAGTLRILRRVPNDYDEAGFFDIEIRLADRSLIPPDGEARFSWRTGDADWQSGTAAWLHKRLAFQADRRLAMEWRGVRKLEIRIDAGGGTVTLRFDMRDAGDAMDWVEKGGQTVGFLYGTKDDDVLMAGVDGVTNPKLRRKIAPSYPSRGNFETAQVILQAIVDTDGSVGDVRVIRCNNPGKGFERAAKRAVRRWRFDPATKDGKPVAVYFTVVVDFLGH